MILRFLTNVSRTEQRTSLERSAQAATNLSQTKRQTYHERSCEPPANPQRAYRQPMLDMPCNAFYCLTNLADRTTNLYQRMENAPDFDHEPPFRNLSEAPLPTEIVPSGSQSESDRRKSASGKLRFRPEKG